MAKLASRINEVEEKAYISNNTLRVPQFTLEPSTALCIRNSWEDRAEDNSSMVVTWHSTLNWKAFDMLS